MNRPAPSEQPRAERSGGSGRRRALILCALALPLLVVLYATILWLSSPRSPGTELRIDQFEDLVADGRIQDATILESDNRIVGTSDQGRYWLAFSGGRETLFARLIGALDQANVPTRVKQQPIKNLVGPATVLLPALIVVDGLFILFLLVGRGGDALAGFGRARSFRQDGSRSRITFSDVAGLDEAIEEIAEIRDYLENPDRFVAMGASVPKGILLTGPPGCGKTLLARSLAGEAGVPFFSIAGSDFVEMFVGVGAARIRDFFATAKTEMPCIVFIDELDAVGRSRSMAAVGGSDEREATLNQLLVELDGFDSGTGVVVLAATNRPDILDAALLRPGRFDRRVTIERPDVRGRAGILRIHARGKPMADGVDLDAVARRTAGFSGADLANVVNEAALLAARRGGQAIEQVHLLEAIERIVAGPERRSRILSPADRLRIAFHEAGHAVVASALGHDRVAKLSIIARGHAGGFTWWELEGDQAAVTRSQLVARITAALAGRAAEELVLGEHSSGATGDLEAAVSLARRMVTDHGMGDVIGPFSLRPLADETMHGSAGLRYSDRLLSEIDAEIQGILRAAATSATDLLRLHRPVLDRVAGALMEAETLDGPALEILLAPLAPPTPPLPATGVGTYAASPTNPLPPTALPEILRKQVQPGGEP